MAMNIIEPESIFSPLLGHHSNSECSIKVYSEHSELTASNKRPLLHPLPQTQTTAMFASHLMHGNFYFVTGSKKRR